jgi:hypothetical protein
MTVAITPTLKPIGSLRPPEPGHRRRETQTKGAGLTLFAVAIPLTKPIWLSRPPEPGHLASETHGTAAGLTLSRMLRGISDG